MDVRIEKSWKQLLADEWADPYFLTLTDFVRKEYVSTRIFPPASKIFAAFDSCPFSEVKVVILGQDPYHGEGMANGLCFSVNDGVPIPRSLCNIYNEIRTDTGHPTMCKGGNLEPWARQGVLLLNATLTVRAHQAGSHQGRGWEQFTDNVIKHISDNGNNIVFILWGAYAAKKARLIDSSRHLILTAPHPSPLSASRGFFGCRHFSKTNSYLAEHGKEPIVW